MRIFGRVYEEIGGLRGFSPAGFPLRASCSPPCYIRNDPPYLFAIFTLIPLLNVPFPLVKIDPFYRGVGGEGGRNGRFGGFKSVISDITRGEREARSGKPAGEK